MHKIKKSLIVAGLALVAAGALMMNPTFVRKAYATVVGMWTYDLFGVRGPVYTFASKAGATVQGVYVTTGPYVAGNSTGTMTAPAGAPFFVMEGSYTTAGRPTCNAAEEGHYIYDTTVHSIAFCDATSWHKLVTGVSANDSWTSY